MKIAIIGLGYVGLPLSLQFARSGVSVLGLDIDSAKTDAVNRGRSYIKHISAEAVQEQRSAGRFEASTDFSRIREVEAVIICVPTPLNKNREPDISYIIETGKAIAPYLREAQVGDGRSEMGDRESTAGAADGRLRMGDCGAAAVAGDGNSKWEERGSETQAAVSRLQSSSARSANTLIPNSYLRFSISSEHAAKKLIVLESTTYPGTTDEDLRAVLETGSGLKAGEDFHLAFSPEREDPANPQSVVASIPKVVGGYTPACLERATELYGRAIKTLVPVSSCRAAEATKLLENIFRSVNIALVNELKLVYGAMGIDIWEVINAAKTKPFGFMPFYPGPGLGGHCIPIDPFYLTWKAREYGQNTRFIELAGEVNTSMPQHVLHRVAEALNDRRKALNGSKVLILGLAYKPNVDDDRESPSYVLINLLTAAGAEVGYHDPYVPEIKHTREHPHLAGIRSESWNRANIGGYDAVLIATNHASVNYAELAAWSPCIIDTRNAMAAIKTKEGQVWKA